MCVFEVCACLTTNCETTSSGTEVIVHRDQETEEKEPFILLEYNILYIYVSTLSCIYAAVVIRHKPNLSPLPLRLKCSLMSIGTRVTESDDRGLVS